MMRTPAFTLSATLPFINDGTISSKESSRRNNAESVDVCFMLSGMLGKKEVDVSSWLSV
jgi:hypothetical protein